MKICTCRVRLILVSYFFFSLENKLAQETQKLQNLEKHMGQSDSENAVALKNLQSKLSQAQEIISEKNKLIQSNEGDISDLKKKLELKVRIIIL